MNKSSMKIYTEMALFFFFCGVESSRDAVKTWSCWDKKKPWMKRNHVDGVFTSSGAKEAPGGPSSSSPSGGWQCDTLRQAGKCSTIWCCDGISKQAIQNLNLQESDSRSGIFSLLLNFSGNPVEEVEPSPPPTSVATRPTDSTVAVL